MQLAFASMLDVLCPVTIQLGTASMRIRDCVALGVNSVIRLNEGAGDDLDVYVGRVNVARGEVLVIEDSTSIRITDIRAPETEMPQ